MYKYILISYFKYQHFQKPPTTTFILEMSLKGGVICRLVTNKLLMQFLFWNNYCIDLATW